MANKVQKTIDIIFNGTDNLSTVLDDIGSNMDSLGSGMQDVAAPFQTGTKAILALDAALTALAIGGLTYALSKSMEFETAVVELEKVMGKGAGVEESIIQAKALSEAYGESATSILGSVADFKQAGFDISDSLTLTKDAMDLVIAGGIDTAQASNLIVASLKGFGLEADQARRLLDILNETSNNYATSVEQLAVGMAGISPIANQMGFSMEDTAGLLTPVIEIFRSGDLAANALKTGLLKLIDDSKPVADALAAIGVSQRDSNGELRTGKEIYFDVATAFQTMDENQKLFITSQLVGLEQSAKMVTVFDNLALSTEISKKAMNSAGSAALEVAAQLETSERAVAKFQTSFENLAVGIGDQFTIAAKEAVDGGAELIQAIRKLVEDGSFDPLFDKIEEIAKALGSTLSDMAKSLPEAMKGVDFTELIASFENVADSIGLVFDDIDLTSPEGLKDAIQLIIDTLAALGDATAGIIDGFGPFLDGLSGLWDMVTDLDGETIELVGTILALGSAFGIAGTAVIAGGAFVSGLSTLLGLVTTGGALSTGLVGLVTILTGPVGLAAAFVGVGVAVAGFSLGQIEEDGKLAILAIEAQAEAVKGLTDQIKELPVEVSTIEIFAAIETGDLEAAQDLIDDIITAEYIAEIGTDVDTESIEDFQKRLYGLPKDILVGVELDKEVIDETTEILKYWFRGEEYSILVPVETSGIEKVKEDIDGIPTEKAIEIKLQGEIDTQIALIKASAETAEASFKYTAEVDIVEAQEATKQIQAAFDSLNTSIESSAGVYEAAFGGAESASYQARTEALDILRQEQELRDQSFALQKQLTEAEIAYTDARTAALAAGDAAVTIDSTGLEPALEMIMFEIIKKVQIRVNETAGDLLLT